MYNTEYYKKELQRRRDILPFIELSKAEEEIANYFNYIQRAQIHGWEVSEKTKARYEKAWESKIYWESVISS